MFNYHNLIKIEHDKTIFSPNSVLDFRSAIYQNKPFAKYILLSSAGSTFKKEASLSFINADVLSGPLCAEYCAEFGDSSLDGESFFKCGLSEDGANYLNAAEFEPFVKRSGKSVNVSVTIYLTDGDGDQVKLCGGNNPLARLLLGYESLSEPGCVATDFNMESPHYYGEFDKNSIVPAQCDFSGSGINISATLSPVLAESVFTFREIPALKASNFASSLIAMNLSAVPNAEKCLNIDEKNVHRVNLTRQGSVLSDTVLCANFNKIIKTDGILSLMTSKESVLRTDIYGNYLAISFENEICFYAVENGLPIYRFKTAAGKNGFDVCIGGFLAVFDAQQVRIYNQTGTLVSSVDAVLGSSSVIVNEGACFHLATVSGNSLKRYRIAGNSINSLNSYTYSTAPVIFRCFSKIGVAGKYLGYYFDSTTASATINTVLYSLFNYASISKIEFGDNIAYVKAASISRIVNLADGAFVNIGGDEDCDVFGLLLIRKSANGKKIYCYDRGKRTLAEIGGNIDVKKVSSLCRAGDFVVALSDEGRVETYYANKCGAYVYNANFNTTDTATVTYQYKGKQNITTKLAVEAAITINQ